MEKVHPRIDVTPEQIQQFCQKWKIVRFELFGSVLRDDFDAESDIDVLVTFAPDAESHRIGELMRIEEELKQLFGRKVDFVERPLVEKSRNWIRRRRILESAQLIYAAA